MNTSPTDTTDLERLARKRAGAKLRWFIHATVYAVVNLTLLLGTSLSGRSTHMFPLLGWGLALLIHGLLVWFGLSIRALRKRMVAHERSILSAQRDAW